MRDTDKARFIQVINATYTFYGKPEPDPIVIKMFFSALERYTLEEVMAGINAHCQNTDEGQYLPKPAHIIKNITGTSETQAESAWTKVDKAIRGVGPHRDACFDDSIIHAVITDMGGWIELCRVTEEEYPFKHNEFVKRYRGYIGRPPTQHQSRLTGIDNGYNMRNGFELQPPALVGESQKAIEVLESGSLEAPKIIHRAEDVATNVLEKRKLQKP